MDVTIFGTQSHKKKQQTRAFPRWIKFNTRWS